MEKFLVLLLLASCDTTPPPRPSIRASATASSSSATPIASGVSIDALEKRAMRLGAGWNDVEQSYSRSLEELERADAAHEEAKKAFGEASEKYRQTTEALEEARRRWRFYQTLVVAAAAIDARNLEAFRSATGASHVSSLDCEDGMSTARFREILLAQGVGLVGRDIDHIVPRSLGGADHPANYRVLEAGENRSLGDAWNREKCLDAGKQCAGAVAVSRKCGTFRGTGF